MNKMKILQGIIEENIEWFWSNDSLVSYETDVTNLWNGFKAWCVQNCLEVLDGLDESLVDRTVEYNYSNWLNRKATLYVNMED